MEKNENCKEKNQDIELLNFIYQNSQMGVTTINQLLDIVEGEDFKNHMKAQLEEYRKINTAAKSMLNKHDCDEKGLNAYEKVRTYLMIDMQTLTDKTPSHIAEMMIIGSTMGVVKAIRDVHKCSGADENVIALMQKLCDCEEENITQLKKFL